jgi:hypothetical protein
MMLEIAVLWTSAATARKSVPAVIYVCSGVATAWSQPWQVHQDLAQLADK